MKKIISWLLWITSIVLVWTTFASGSVMSWTIPTTGSVCQEVRKSTHLSVSQNLTTMRTNMQTLRKKHSGRWQQFVVTNKRSQAQRTHKNNQEEIRKLHKELVKKYYTNSGSVTTQSYAAQISALRLKFFDGLSGSIASGKQTSFDAFKADYMTMYTTNRTLRFENIVARHNAHVICQNQEVELTRQKIKKWLDRLKNKEGKIEKRSEKTAKKLESALRKLEERKYNLIQKLWEHDEQEDDGRDSEPSN